MQRVSTAFVGQVSAASSPATAKLKGRARATNDPAFLENCEQEMLTPSISVDDPLHPCAADITVMHNPS
jgi:hypothetical protein